MHARTNGIDTHYTLAGNGPWLVLSHSLACDYTMWAPQIEALSDRYRILAYDTRGHGKSSAPQGAYTLDMLAEDLKALLDSLGINQCHFAGLSMGGMIGQTFALKYPGIFKTLTLADTTSRYPADGAAMWGDRIKMASEKGMGAMVEGTLQRWFTDGYRQSNPNDVKRVANLIENTPVAGYAGCAQAISKINVTDRLKEIKSPTMIVVGDKDAGTPPALSHAIQQAMPGSELYIIKDASHISNVEKAAAFTHVLSTFIGKHR
jgi:3-oxoadipate enol-lactonase